MRDGAGIMRFLAIAVSAGACLLIPAPVVCHAQSLRVPTTMAAREAALAIAENGERRAIAWGEIFEIAAADPDGARADSLVRFLYEGALQEEDEALQRRSIFLLAEFSNKGHAVALEHVLTIWEGSARAQHTVLFAAGQLPPVPRVVHKLETIMRAGLPHDEGGVMAAHAVSKLAELGPVGQAVLRRVHASGERLHGAANAQLRMLARRDFRP